MNEIIFFSIQIDETMDITFYQQKRVITPHAHTQAEGYVIATDMYVYIIIFLNLPNIIRIFEEYQAFTQNKLFKAGC